MRAQAFKQHKRSGAPSNTGHCLSSAPCTGRLPAQVCKAPLPLGIPSEAHPSLPHPWGGHAVPSCHSRKGRVKAVRPGVGLSRNVPSSLAQREEGQSNWK